MGTNFGEALNSAVDEMHSEDTDAKTEQQEEPKAPKKAQATPKKTAEPKADEKPVEEPKADEKPVEEPKADEKPTKGGSPWDAELDKRGINTPEVQAFLSEVTQPYITRLEQNGAGIAGMFGGDEDVAGIAANIMQGLNDDPAEQIKSLIDLFSEVRTEEGAGDFLEELNAKFEGGEAPTGDAEEPDASPETAEEPEAEETPEQKWVRSKIESEQKAEQQKAWDDHVAAVREVVPDLNEPLYTMAMAASNGDQRMASDYYTAALEAMDASKAKDAPKPPPTHSGDRAAPPSAPDNDFGSDLMAAVDAWHDEEMASRGRR